MHSLQLVGAAALSFLLFAAPAVGQDGDVERSSLFTLEAGDRIEDAGIINVTSRFLARTEHFEVVRRADGGRTITNVTIAETYRVEGRFEYDADERALSAVGKAVYDGLPADIKITATPPVAQISVEAGAVQRTVPAPCDPDCLIDMSPSALPMFTMTRLYDRQTGGAQAFRWIGQGLTTDQALLEGVATLRLVDTKTVGDDRVLQFVFVESLTDAVTGDVTSFAFNLWADEAHRPLAFGMVSGTLGTRAGFEDVPVKMPPVFD